MFITKEEAMDVLYELLGTGILKEELENKIEEIHSVLRHEIEDGLNLWGADDEAGELFGCVRSDLITEEYEKRMKELWDKYKIEGFNNEHR